MPEISTPDASKIPVALQDQSQWVCWKVQQRAEKQTKVPVDPTTGTYASTTDESTWAAFDVAFERAHQADLGLGFVFTESDDFVGVDLDGCRDPETGRPETWAREIVKRLDAYTEVSPSGTGYHVIVRGERPDGRNRRDSVEIYDQSRFFTVTGEHVEGTSTDVAERTEALAWLYAAHLDDGEHEETTTPSSDTTMSLTDEQLLERAKQAKNGEKFERLWRGSTAGYESHSEADMALCSLLAFWTGGDASQVDRLFRRSGLLRAKWDDVHYADGSTYGEKTVERAIAGVSEFYTPRERSSEDTKSDVAGEATDRSKELLRELEQLHEREKQRRTHVETLEQRVAELEAENERLRAERDSVSNSSPDEKRVVDEGTSSSFWRRLWPGR